MSTTYGLTLIEILMALLVLSIGLLGFATLQLSAHRQTQNSFLRTQAAISAYAALDILRTRRDSAIDLQMSRRCSPPRGLPIQELVTWFEILHENLGDGSCAEISCQKTTTGLDLCRVTIFWRERYGGDVEEWSFEMRSLL